jgi:hypothetical protein
MLEEQKNCVLLETSRFDQGEEHSYFFFNPAHVISIDQIEEVPELFSEIERYCNEGYFAAGYRREFCCRMTSSTQTPSMSVMQLGECGG